MSADGVRQALAFVTSAFSSYSGCRQYREDIAAGAGRSWSHRAAGRQAPRLLQPSRLHRPDDRADDATPSARFRRRSRPARCCSSPLTAFRRRWPTAAVTKRSSAKPAAWSEKASAATTGSLLYQSRSGPPQQPWLEPDVGDFVRIAARQVHASKCRRRADRIHLRSFGSALRLGHRGPRSVRVARDQHGPRRERSALIRASSA